MKKRRELVRTRFKQKYRKHFFREWREYRDLTLERAAEQIGELTGKGFSHGQLSRIERGEQPYSQVIVEAAEKVYRCDERDLFNRNPFKPDPIWTIWDRAKPEEREIIRDLAETVLKRRAG